MEGQFMVVLWVSKKLPAAAKMEDALAVAKSVKLSDLVTLKPGVGNQDCQITPMGVVDYTALSKLD